MQQIRYIACFLFAAGVVFVACGACTVLVGQDIDNDSSLIRLSGTIMLSAELYTMSASPSGSVTPRRPSSLARLVATPTLQIGDIVLPVTLVLSSRQTNSVTPTLPSENVLQWLQNPLNTVSFSPRWKWAQFHIGTYTPRYSALSTGNLSAFGAGFDFQPGRVRVAAFGGVVQRAVQPDSSRQSVGAYERWLYAARLGIGTQNSGVGITAVRSVDKQSSLQRDPVGITPQEGILAALDFAVEPAPGLQIKGEGAASVYTRNMRANKTEKSNIEFLQSLITLRESSRIDGAAAMSVAYTSAEWGATLAAKYLGDGFVPLGYAYMQTDRIEVTLAPRLLLLDRRVSLTGSMGYRKNNLSQTGLQTSLQLIGSVNASAQVSENFFLSGTYANYGIRSTVRNDTLRYEMISQSASVTPVYTFVTPVGQHSVTLAFSLDDVTDVQALTGVQNHSNTYSALLNYALTLASFPLTSTVTLNGLRSQQALGTTLFTTAVGASYRMENDVFRPSLRVGFTRVAIGSGDADSQVQLRAAVAWKLLPSTVLNVSSSLNLYRYGAAQTREQFQESFLQTSVSTRL